MKCAEGVIVQQNDVTMRTMNELVKQCEVNRMSVNKQNGETSEVSRKNHVSYAEMVTKSYTTIVKPKNESDTIDKNAINKKMEKSLKNVNVNYTRISDSGTIMINVPNLEAQKETMKNLRSVFSNDYDVEPKKMLMPKLTIANVPLYINDNEIVSALCEKDINIRQMVQNGDVCEVIKSWNVKQRNGESVAKTVAVKCSAKIRNYVMNVKNGYIYINLVRCRVFDRFFIPQCYHCRSFNHFARDCPNKEKIAVCGKCADNHETRNCWSEILKCVNCLKNRPNEPNDHYSYSNDCPCLLRERSVLRQKTDYSEEKN